MNLDETRCIVSVTIVFQGPFQNYINQAQNLRGHAKWGRLFFKNGKRLLLLFLDIFILGGKKIF